MMSEFFFVDLKGICRLSSTPSQKIMAKIRAVFPKI